VAYWDADAKYYYVKRFVPELSEKMLNFVDEENAASRLAALTDVAAAVLKVSFGGRNAGRPDELVALAEFIGVKSWRAKGKRLTTYDVAGLSFLAPVVAEPVAATVEPEVAPEVDEVEFTIERAVGDDDAADGGQLGLF
jgi:topoisomerase-4 subunit A